MYNLEVTFIYKIKRYNDVNTTTQKPIHKIILSWNYSSYIKVRWAYTNIKYVK